MAGVYIGSILWVYYFTTAACKYCRRNYKMMHSSTAVPSQHSGFGGGAKDCQLSVFLAGDHADTVDGTWHVVALVGTLG
jgi:hypothetical protein